MKAVFVELPAFERHRPSYLDDEGFLALQNLLMKQPEAGDSIQDTGGLRKLRFADSPIRRFADSPMRGEAKVNAAGCG